MSASSATTSDHREPPRSVSGRCGWLGAAAPRPSGAGVTRQPGGARGRRTARPRAGCWARVAAGCSAITLDCGKGRVCKTGSDGLGRHSIRVRNDPRPRRSRRRPRRGRRATGPRSRPAPRAGSRVGAQPPHDLVVGGVRAWASGACATSITVERIGGDGGRSNTTVTSSPLGGRPPLEQVDEPQHRRVAVPPPAVRPRPDHVHPVDEPAHRQG